MKNALDVLSKRDRYRLLLILTGMTIVGAGAANASGPATITGIKSCDEQGGLTVYQLSDGNAVFRYDDAAQHTKNLHALMLSTWATNRVVQTYEAAQCGSNCGLWACFLTSVNPK